MDKDIEDSTWDEKSIVILDDFENNRNLVLRATKNLLSGFYRQNFQGNERVLELGSGTGFLRRSWPDEFQGEWIQLDSQPAFLEESKRRFPEGTYVNASAYDLPFPDESFDVVCGFGSYDVLMDLETAIAEGFRVLKEGGLFFHMLDLLPCTEPIENDLKHRKVDIKTEGYIMSDGYTRTKSIFFIPEENLELYYQAIKSIRDDADDFFEQEDKIRMRYSKEIVTKDYFEDKLMRVLSYYFNAGNVKNGEISAKYKGKLTKQQRQEERGPFVFFRNAGLQYEYNNSLQYGVHQLLSNHRLVLPYILNVLPSFHDHVYRVIKHLSPKLSKKMEPSCLEISGARYVKARK